MLVTAGLVAGICYLVRAYVRYRDSRLIVCPESGEAAMVEVDAVHAALTSTLGHTDIRLQNCWRWPLHQDCNQECLVQLDVAAADCLVRGILRRWYESKQCHFCGMRFEQIGLLDHEPALYSRLGKLIEWRKVPIEGLHDVLKIYEPVCWNCYIAQLFRQEHPDLVVYRPWRPGIPRSG